MFAFLKKDPSKDLQKQYELKLQEALHAQRNGDIRSYSMLSSEAELILKKIDGLKAHNRSQ